METIVNFFKTSITPIFGTHHLRVWHVAVAAVVLIVLVIIAVAVSRKKKSQPKTETSQVNDELAPEEQTPVAAPAENQAVTLPAKEPVIPVVTAEEPAKEEKAEKTETVTEENVAEETVASPAKDNAEEVKTETAQIEEPVKEVVAAEPAEENKEPAHAEEVEQKAEPVKTEKSAKKPAEKKSTAKAPAKTAAKTEKAPAKKLNGKWRIVRKKEDEYISELLASNGEVMLTSETYSTAEGAIKGIATIIKGVDGGNFIIYRDKGGNYYYKLKSASNKLLCVGEIYTNKDGCVAAAETVKRIAKGSPVTGGVIDGEEYVAYTPEAIIAEAKKGARGKWKIEKGEFGYSARLYANNGQLMMATEEVKEKSTATAAVASVKKNSASGNFIIDKDKFGRFYYKLRNSQKSVICIGEAYDTLEACISALESVRKFAEYSDIAESEPSSAKTETK